MYYTKRHEQRVKALATKQEASPKLYLLMIVVCYVLAAAVH